ncbi:hypothetical protein [Mediterraneibacter agrestimuris]|uniref:hypothetical protein n=1 Tax=Mediterraneibacter agrestimuris TaxID=2941333 RepID=UPI00203BE328|nr:hypothetical protein [Mediterraneibacter agrestimuris]
MHGELKKYMGELYVKVIIFVFVISPVIIAVLSVKSFSTVKSVEDSQLLRGTEAISKERERYQYVRGVLDQEKLNEALYYYQSISLEDIAYVELGIKYPGIVDLLYEAYTNVYGEGNHNLYDLKNANNFYSQNTEQIEKIFEQQPQEYTEWEQQIALSRAEKVRAPFYIEFSRQWKIAIKNIGILLLIYSIAIILIGTNSFAYEKEKNMELILATLDTKKLYTMGWQKIKTFLLFISVMYFVMVAIYSVVYFFMTGFSGWKSPIQIEYFTIIYNITFLQAYLLIIFTGWICSMAIGMVIVVLNSFLQSVYSTLAVGFLLIYSPLIISKFSIVPNGLKTFMRLQPVNALMTEKLLVSLHSQKFLSISIPEGVFLLICSIFIIGISVLVVPKFFSFRINRE